MVDQLASAADLAAALQVAVADLNSASATLLLEVATGLVQAATGGQRLVLVEDDEVTLTGTTDSYLDLPQIPVVEVSAVELDGVALSAGTDYRVVGNRLWRGVGWQSGDEPSEAVVTYSHGYAAAAQELQLARSVVLSLARSGYVNPSGTTSEGVDDYRASWDVTAARMEISSSVRAALRRRYGRRAGLVRVG